MTKLGKSHTKWTHTQRGRGKLTTQPCGEEGQPQIEEREDLLLCGASQTTAPQDRYMQLQFMYYVYVYVLYVTSQV